MCVYSDLFGDVIVTVNDVNLWLDIVPNLRGASNSRRNYYAKYNDVASKIKLSKLDGSFEKLITQYQSEIEYNYLTLDCLSPRYVELPCLKPCPVEWHVCENPKCAFFIKSQKHAKSHSRYMKNKSLANKKPANAGLVVSL